MPKFKAGIIHPTVEEDAAITAAALADPDAVPFTDAEWAQVKPLVRRGYPQAMTARDKSYEQATAQALTDPIEAAAYIDAALKLDGPNALLIALQKVVDAHGLAEVARRAGVDERTLPLDLSESGNATLNTVQKVLHAVGLRLSVAPINDPLKP